MAIADAHGLPAAVCIVSASPHEVTLVEQAVEASFIDEMPERLVDDKAYDSDPLDEKLREDRGLELIAPHREKRRRAKTQNGRALRRYRRRGKMERLFDGRL